MNKLEKSKKELIKIFKSDSTVTVAELLTCLSFVFPEESWTHQWVNNFLQSEELEWEVSSDKIRIYHAKNKLQLEDLEEYMQFIVDTKEDITKSNLKSLCRGGNFNLDNFKELFDELGLEHTGKYTPDNHKVWVKVPVGQHLSKNKGVVIPIKDMAKPYLRNALAKYTADHGYPDMYTILGQPTTEFYKLLQAFFTHDLRNVI